MPAHALENAIDVRTYGAVGDGVTDDTDAIQDAMDSADTKALLFPAGTYIAAGLTLTRNISLLGVDPAKCRIQAPASASATTDVLTIAITSNDGALDVRNWRMENLLVHAVAGGRTAVKVTDDSTAYPILTSAIRNCNMKGNTANSGYSLHIDDNFSHGVIELNTFQSGTYLSPRDANSIRKNLNFGTDIAYTVDMIFGVHNNTICDNTIVNGGGAVHLINGDAVRIVNNQIEQLGSYGENPSTPSASIHIEGADRVSYNTVIENNNFGGGTNVDYSVYVDNGSDTIITRNQFVASDEVDIYLTANADNIKVMPDNYVRSTGSNPRSRTIFKPEVTDLGVGNMGVLHPSSELAHQNGWSGGDFYKDAYGRVHFTTQFNGGTTANSTVIGTLPSGFRPPANVYLPVNSASGTGQVRISTGGIITASGALPSTIMFITGGFISTQNTG